MQYDDVLSITQINVWLGSNGVNERLRSLSGFCCCFGLRIDWLHWRVDRGADGAISRLIIGRSMRCHRRSPHSIYTGAPADSSAVAAGDCTTVVTTSSRSCAQIVLNTRL